MKLFTKQERSTFSYWFAHWCAFQMTALILHRWKLKYLFHDFEKPWLKLFLPYKTIQKWHRTHNKHHIEYGEKHGYDKVDWEAMLIDWECSHYTKENCPRNAYDEAYFYLWGLDGHKELIDVFNKYVWPKLKELGLKRNVIVNY